MIYYSQNGKKVNTSIYPDFEQTRYMNWDNQSNMNKRVPVLYEHKKDCCGCYACYCVCPKEAISMGEDLEGFVYPKVDLSICVKCYACETVCPIKDHETKV